MICHYVGQVNPYNRLCNTCNLYLECCVPIHTAGGYCLGECDLYLCEGCDAAGCQMNTERERPA